MCSLKIEKGHAPYGILIMSSFTSKCCITNYVVKLCRDFTRATYLEVRQSEEKVVTPSLPSSLKPMILSSAPCLISIWNAEWEEINEKDNFCANGHSSKLHPRSVAMGQGWHICCNKYSCSLWWDIGTWDTVHSIRFEVACLKGKTLP